MSGARPSSLKRAARLIARPALSPIDGRVADINRRVESVRASTEASLDAYAQSAAESSSYIGVELRRLHDLLAAVGERIDVALSADAAAAVQVSEEIVTVPFAMAALGRLERGARILDIGGSERTFALSAASLGYQVTVVDERPVGYAHPNLETHRSSLERWDAPSRAFAAVFVISPARYVGADVALADRIRGLLSADGLVIFTVPYDKESLSGLLERWQVLDRRLVVRRDALVWESDDQVEPGARAVAMVIATARPQ